MLSNHAKFHVVSVVSNPCRYQSRYDLYKEFEEDIKRKGGKLWTIEMQTGARRPQITEFDHPNHIQVFSSALPGELWHKESLLNLAIQQLSIAAPDWRYVMWADADIKFEKGALDEITHALQHWDVVQCWSHAVDFGPQGESTGLHDSFMYCYWKGIEPVNKYGYLAGGHPGFAWGCRREAFNKLGGLLDFAILGSSDRHMACALVGRAKDSVHPDVHPNYRKWLMRWQDRAEKEIKRNVGFVHGTIRHMWHGRKADRQYASRWKILVKHQFDPEADIIRDSYGIWQLVVETPRQMALRDDLRKYFRARKEDATTI